MGNNTGLNNRDNLYKQINKNRTMSSHGSLRSGNNAASGSIINKTNQNRNMNLNKSGVSATSGIMNFSNYQSNGTMLSQGLIKHGTAGTVVHTNGTMSSADIEQMDDNNNVYITNQATGHQYYGQINMNTLSPITREV